MKKTSLIIAIFWISILIICSAYLTDNNNDLCKSFINSLNEGKTDEAAKFCSDSIKIKFNYNNSIKNKIDFFSYLKKRASLKSKIIIDSLITINNKILIYSKNTNSFNQYLKLHALPLKYSFSVEENQITEINIDSLKGYNDSLRINDRRWLYFEKWTVSKHEGLNLYYVKLQYPDSLLMLAKEFYLSAIKK